MQDENQDVAANSINPQDQKVFWMATIPIGLLINHGMGLLTLYIKLPIYLDSIGTLLVGILVGTRAGVVTSIMSCLLGGLFINPMIPYYIVTFVAIALFGGWMASKGFFRTVPRAIVTAIAMGLISGTCTAPVVYFLGGFSGTCTDVTTALLLATGQSLFMSSFLSKFANDPFDKIIQCLIVVWLIRGFPKGLIARFKNSGYLAQNVLR